MGMGAVKALRSVLGDAALRGCGAPCLGMWSSVLGATTQCWGMQIVGMWGG